MMMFIAFFVSLVGVIMLISLLKNLSFQKNGTECTAKVIDTKAETYYKTEKRGDRTKRVEKTKYYLVVEYDVNGMTYTGNIPVSENETADAIGTSIDIIYKTNKPEKLLAGTLEKNKSDNKVVLIATIVCIVIAIVLWLIALF